MFDNGTIITDQGYTWHCWFFGDSGVVRVSPEALASHHQDIYRHAHYAFENLPLSYSEFYRSGEVVIYRWKNAAGQDIVTIDIIDSKNFRRGVRLLAGDGQNRTGIHS
ncbi:MAG TPA: hypothetical protein VN688_07660 [Gemmataceae bacterium]|nr:hypothetical protein [Gemmataceae bacterium]